MKMEFCYRISLKGKALYGFIVVGCLIASLANVQVFYWSSTSFQQKYESSSGGTRFLLHSNALTIILFPLKILTKDKEQSPMQLHKRKSSTTKEVFSYFFFFV